MTLDFQQVQEQVRQMGEKALARERQLNDKRRRAQEALENHAQEVDKLRQRVDLISHNYDPSLRCALPVAEHLDFCSPVQDLPAGATIIAVDGSQIFPDRHAETNYCLLNVGALEIRQFSPEPPRTTIHSELLYDDQLYTQSGTITEEALSMRRDMREREMLVELTRYVAPPVITFTDGPMELWGAKDGDGANEYRKTLQAYKGMLSRLQERQVTTAGYVDKPGANLVVRLLELMLIPETELAEVKKTHPLRGVADADLYHAYLEPGERSAVFAIQSQSAKNYPGELALHFFYLNVGRAGHPWLARVEVPAWVTHSPQMLADLQAVLVDQCRIMGNRPYPYLLHRAHEAALVTYEEKEQLGHMIAIELRRRGASVGSQSHKQSAKVLSGRTRYAG